MRIAAIADIHSNTLALEAVLEDISGQNADEIVHLGDAFNGPIDPRGVAEILQATPMVHVRGNGERMVLSDEAGERSRSAEYARQLLDAPTLEWVRGWPLLIERPEYCAFHATPDNDLDYLLEELVEGGVRLKSRRDIALSLQRLSAPLLLCGHTHLPQYVRLDENRAIVNPGSVGLPAYEDVRPIPHRMQTGSPDARYAVIDIRGRELTVSHRSIPYDYRRAAELARNAGFPDWVPALMSGYAE
ncbi:YfcE family phosphodiesterase [Opitutaceae bacterium EW11]|nr:YfcE family phosphodiesterase [Opitutaceae bacterium EW11]